MNSLVIQFAKWPVLGQVKTRLAKDIGDRQALQVHMDLMTHVLNNTLSDSWHSVLSFSQLPDQQPSALQDLFEVARCHDVKLVEQVGEGLGDRMAYAISNALAHYDQVIVVGSDCPTVDKQYLESAFAALDNSDLVLGPAEDGGYVLIGASAFNEGVFKGVNWGTDTVRAQTIDNAQSLGMKVSLLATTWDVDTLEDFKRWQG